VPGRLWLLSDSLRLLPRERLSSSPEPKTCEGSVVERLSAPHARSCRSPSLRRGAVPNVRLNSGFQARRLSGQNLGNLLRIFSLDPVSERVPSFARVINMSTESISPEARATTPDVVSRLVASHARFLAFLERRVASRQAAEDILQEAFVRALDRGESLRSDESAQAWFYRLLRNAIIDHYRRKGVERRALDRVAAEPEHDAASSADAELHTTVCDCMSDLIETLKPEYAEALRKVDLAQDGLTSYAKALGITNNNASVRLHRAREALHKQLILSCGTCATHGCLDCHCDRTGKGQCGS